MSIGQIEVLVSGVLHGWVRVEGLISPIVEIVENGQVIASASADAVRPDLGAAGRGFRIPIPERFRDGKRHVLDVRLRHGGCPLGGSPLVLEGLTGFAATITGVCGPVVRIASVGQGGRPPACWVELWDGGVYVDRAELTELPGEAGRASGVHGFRLPTRFLDGQVHDVHVNDPLGAPLNGSPFSFRCADPEQGRGTASQAAWAGQEGTLDIVAGRQVQGWAWCRFAPDQPVELELCDGDRPVDRFTADMFRADLLEGGLGTGRYGFCREVPEGWHDGGQRTLVLRFADSHIPLRGTPLGMRFHPPSGDAARTGGRETDRTSRPQAELEFLRRAVSDRDRLMASLASALALAIEPSVSTLTAAPSCNGGAFRIYWCVTDPGMAFPTLADTLDLLARAASEQPVEVMITAPGSAETRIARNITVRRIDPGPGPEQWMPDCDLMLVPDMQEETQSRRSICRALARHIPVLAAGSYGLPPAVRDLVVQDWERRIRHLVGMESAPTWAPASRAERRIRLLVLLDNADEAELFEPLFVALSRRTEWFAPTAVFSQRAAAGGRGTASAQSLGIPVEIVERQALIDGRVPSLDMVDAVLVTNDSSVPAHIVPHALVRRCNAMGLRSYAVQHGLESVGLSYFDDVHGYEVEIAADRIFTWFPKAAAPTAMRADVRRRLVPVGSLREPVPVVPRLPVAQAGRPLIGVFENLHWHRYSDRYRQAFLAQLTAVAEHRPDMTFMLKPHPFGRWTALRTVQSMARNLVVADPADPAWRALSAPALMPALAAVITTPSTVAHDAARAHRPLAVFGGDLDLPLYQPLPILRDTADWLDFLTVALSPGRVSSIIGSMEAFLGRHLVSGPAADRILDWIEADFADAS